MSIIGQTVVREPLITEISDATAEQWHVKTGKTAYIVGGKVTGTAYTPAMMQFDGSTGYYSQPAVTTANNFFTCVARIHGVAATGGAQTIFRVGTTNLRLFLEVASGSNQITARAWENTTNNQLLYIQGNTVVTDGDYYTIFLAYNADAGTAVMYVNGQDDIDTGFGSHVITTGTLSTGSATITIGANHVGALLLGGEIGFVGYRDAYLTNWSDFMQADGTPKEIDEIGWKQWGGQPLFWNKGGLMTDNAGSAGAMTKNGTITGPSGGWPLFWNEHGQVSNNLGSAGDMTENGTIKVGNGGNYV